MLATWRSGFNPAILVRDLNEVRTQKDGKVSYKSFMFEWARVALVSSLDFSRDLHPASQDAVVRQALFEATPNGKLNKDALLLAIDKRVREHLSKLAQTFYLRTSVSLLPPPLLNQLGFAGCRFLSRFPEGKFTQHSLLERAEHLLHAPLPTNYQPMLVEASGRTHDEASQTALRAFDALRGVLNLQVNAETLIRSSWGTLRDPVNQIRSSPFHSLHLKSGALATETIWYDPSYVKAAKLYDPRGKRQGLVRITLRVARRLERSSLKRETTEALVRYAQALDQWNWETAFLELWGLLEFLTNTGRATYETTIRRASMMFENSEAYLEILKHLRDQRNRYVHSKEEHPEIETLMFQAKLFVDRFLRFYINNPFGLKSRGEVGEFFDLPASKRELARRIELTKAAVRFRSPNPQTTGKKKP